ncbi:hypothetical protein PENSPDRAFT_654664 [Peniophora sp. CONT]|nr:hypothetical protein PENSPDRAFT_654664 [Peniophora sp. CONT]
MSPFQAVSPTPSHYSSLSHRTSTTARTSSGLPRSTDAASRSATTPIFMHAQQIRVGCYLEECAITQPERTQAEDAGRV